MVGGNLRHRQKSRTRVVVCGPYERLKKKWENLVDGNMSPVPTPDESKAISVAHESMTAHRESCEQCKTEDQAVQQGDVAALDLS
jgi:hypothetical protein